MKESGEKGAWKLMEMKWRHNIGRIEAKENVRAKEVEQPSIQPTLKKDAAQLGLISFHAHLTTNFDVWPTRRYL